MPTATPTSPSLRINSQVFSDVVDESLFWVPPPWETTQTCDEEETSVHSHPQGQADFVIQDFTVVSPFERLIWTVEKQLRGWGFPKTWKGSLATNAILPFDGFDRNLFVRLSATKLLPASGSPFFSKASKYQRYFNGVSDYLAMEILTDDRNDGVVGSLKDDTAITLLGALHIALSNIGLATVPAFVCKDAGRRDEHLGGQYQIIDGRTRTVQCYCSAVSATSLKSQVLDLLGLNWPLRDALSRLNSRDPDLAAIATHYLSTCRLTLRDPLPRVHLRQIYIIDDWMPSSALLPGLSFYARDTGHPLRAMHIFFTDEASLVSWTKFDPFPFDFRHPEGLFKPQMSIRCVHNPEFDPPLARSVVGLCDEMRGIGQFQKAHNDFLKFWKKPMTGQDRLIALVLDATSRNHSFIDSLQLVTEQLEALPRTVIDWDWPAGMKSVEGFSEDYSESFEAPVVNQIGEAFEIASLCTLRMRIKCAALKMMRQEGTTLETATEILRALIESGSLRPAKRALLKAVLNSEVNLKPILSGSRRSSDEETSGAPTVIGKVSLGANEGFLTEDQMRFYRTFISGATLFRILLNAPLDLERYTESWNQVAPQPGHFDEFSLYADALSLTEAEKERLEQRLPALDRAAVCSFVETVAETKHPTFTDLDFVIADDPFGVDDAVAILRQLSASEALMEAFHAMFRRFIRVVNTACAVHQIRKVDIRRSLEKHLQPEAGEFFMAGRGNPSVVTKEDFRKFAKILRAAEFRMLSVLSLKKRLPGLEKHANVLLSLTEYGEQDRAIEGGEDRALLEIISNGLAPSAQPFLKEYILSYGPDGEDSGLDPHSHLLCPKDTPALYASVCEDEYKIAWRRVGINERS